MSAKIIKFPKKYIVLLFWWFLLFDWNYPRVIGPFGNEKQCTKSSNDIVKLQSGLTISKCWDDSNVSKDN